MAFQSTILKTGLKSFGAVSVGGLGCYGTYLYQTDEGIQRTMKFYKTFVPVVLAYRYAEFRNATSQEFEELDQHYAIPAVSKLGELQGMYCKYGQTAAGLTNTFGDAWITEFRKLENEVPPRHIDAIHRTIEEETGLPVHETFDYFDPVPLGSASIGQVHRAILKCNKREVAVKVQYAEAQHLFQEDIHTIRQFCETFAPEHVVLLDAIEKQNAAELDYRNEAQNLSDVATNMKRHGFQPSEVVVPQPLPEWTTHRMLVMDLLPGPKLNDGIRQYVAKWAKENGTTIEDLEVEARKKIETGDIPDKYDGPSAFQISLYRRYLTIKDCLFNIGIRIYNSSLGWATKSPPVKYQKSVLPPNVPRIVDTLMRVHGYQLLSDGIFNADPHGGNFVLLPDGRIGMIDYGATKRFTRNERLTMCLMYAALARNDEDRLWDLTRVGGYRSKHGRHDVLMKLIQFGYDSWGHEVIGDQNVQQFIDDLKHKDPWESVPDNFTMTKVR